MATTTSLMHIRTKAEYDAVVEPTFDGLASSARDERRRQTTIGFNDRVIT